MTDATERSRVILAEWALGSIASKYESGGRGPGTVSTGQGDAGGVSYGTYQLSSRQPNGKPGTVYEYLAQSRFSSEFDGLTAGTEGFTDKWRQLAASEPAFGREQHKFINDSHYGVVMANLERKGIDLTARGPAVQEAIISTATQYRALTDDIIKAGVERLHGPNADVGSLSDAQLVIAIQTQKFEGNDRYFTSSSPLVRSGVASRITRELDDLLVLARADEIRQSPERFEGLAADEAFRIENPLRERLAMSEQLNLGDRGAGVEALQRQLMQAGYTGKDGQALKPDGDFGANTKYAVEELQRAHGLQVDGKAGMHSLRALADEAQNGRPAPKLPEPERAPGRFEDASLRADPLFQSVRGHVHAMDRAMGRTPDEASDRVAAALCAECRANGLTRVDGVVLGQRGTSAQPGEFVFAYAGPSERPNDWVRVKTAEAVQTPVEQSFAKAETLQREQALEAQQLAQARQQVSEASSRGIS